MERRNLILSLLAIGCFIATATLFPGLGTAQADKVKAEKLGAPKVEGKDLKGSQLRQLAVQGNNSKSVAMLKNASAQASLGAFAPSPVLAGGAMRKEK